MTSPIRLRRVALALLLATALPRLAAAAPPALAQATREQWSYRDGLPHNLVQRVLASRSGYLWLGTQEGLVRFDGIRFKVFARRDTPGLTGDVITALVEDDRGVVWIGTATGLSRLVGDAILPVGLGAGDHVVTDVVPDGAGGAWIATDGGGVLHVRGAAGAPLEPLAGLRDPRVLALARDGEVLWIGGPGGLARLADGRVEQLEPAWPAGDEVTRLLPARDGTLWVGTLRGLARVRPRTARLERTTLTRDTSVATLLEDRDGALWVGLEGGPLLRVVDDVAEEVAGPAAPSNVLALARDAGGDLWVGTGGGAVGLWRLRWGPVVTFAVEEGLAADLVRAVREGRGGVTWVVSDGGLDAIVGGRPRRAYAAALAGEALVGLLEDRSGELWVGAISGLIRLGPRGTIRYGPGQGLAGPAPRTLLEDQRGRIWAGTLHGVYRLDGARFSPLATDPALGGDRINVIAEQPDGTLWVGASTGLARIEGERLLAARTGDEPIRGNVMALLPDAGALWLGTGGDGLARLAGGRLERWTQREGLHEDTVHAILDDGAGHLWLAGNHGISRVARAELDDVAAGRRRAVSPLVFGTAEGMRDRECSGGVTPSAWRASDGRLWFATIRGVAVIDPTRLEPPRRPPPARVEELVADGRLALPAGEPRFPAGTRHLDIRYTGLALGEAERIRFRHRLAGLDEGWVDAAGERVAHYTGLGPGRYAFEVQASGGAGEWGPPDSVPFEVAPHPWQTQWFRAAAALAAVAAILGAHLARTAALRRREALLATRVEEEMRKVKVLSGLLRACSWCNKIKDETGAWRRYDDYVASHTDATFTHGMCPDCAARMEDGRD